MFVRVICVGVSVGWWGKKKRHHRKKKGKGNEEEEEEEEVLDLFFCVSPYKKIVVECVCKFEKSFCAHARDILHTHSHTTSREKEEEEE